MAKQYRIYQIDAFTKEKLKGNPAGVVTNADGLSEQQMQEIAREFNNSETAFILSPEDDSYSKNSRECSRGIFCRTGIVILFCIPKWVKNYTVSILFHTVLSA